MNVQRTVMKEPQTDEKSMTVKHVSILLRKEVSSKNKSLFILSGVFFKYQT